MKWAMVAALFLAMVGCSDGSSPDTVVGVVAKCGIPSSETTGDACTTGTCSLAPNNRFTGTQAECSKRGGELTLMPNGRLEVTVKPHSGAVYKIDQPLGSAVKVGDTWPPK